MKNDMVQRPPRSKIAAFINWGVMLVAILVIVSIILTLCYDKIAADIGKISVPTIGSSVITILYAIRWRIEKNAQALYAEQQEKMYELERKVNFLLPLRDNIDEMFDVWLLYILNYMKMGTSSRVSFYVYDDRGGKNDRFCFVARESKDPRNKRKGRSFYPFDQGVIGAAWREERAKCNLFLPNDIKSRDDYVSYMVTHGGLSKEVAEELTMQAKCILGELIVDTSGKVGVVVFEGDTYVNGVKNRKRIKEDFSRLTKEVSPYLCKLFSIYSNQIFSQENPN